MCGRTRQARSLEQIANQFGIEEFELQGYTPKYNLGPSQTAAIVLGHPPRLELMIWGIPITVQSRISAMINIKKETLERGRFRNQLLTRRCIFPVDGFYEWQSEGREKYPFHFSPNDGSLFLMPAIYEEVHDKGHRLRTFSIFTTLPNSVVAPIHHRMPALLNDRLETDQWLDPSKNAAELLALINPYPDERMTCFEVSQALNSGKNEGPQLVIPTTSQRQPRLF